MDEIDRAQSVNEQLQADALGAWKRRQPSGQSRSFCIDCDEPIPDARRRAVPGCCRCIDCQRAFEEGA